MSPSKMDSTRGEDTNCSPCAAIAAKLCESAAQAKGCLALAAEPQKQRAVPVFSDTQIERMGVTSNRFLLACLNKCVSGKLYETCENCSVFDYWIPLTPLTSRQVSFSHRLLSRPPTSCVTKLRISQTQIPTSNNIYPLVIRKLTVLMVIISKWICPSNMVAISRGSPFPSVHKGNGGHGFGG